MIHESIIITLKLQIEIVKIYLKPLYENTVTPTVAYRTHDDETH